MSVIHFLNDHWVKTEDLKISAFDLTVTRGFGIFDFLRTYNKKPFRLREHIDRFFNSARILGLPVPKTKKEIEKIISQGLARNKQLKETNIKIILTGGPTEDGITPIGRPSLIITFTPAVQYPRSCYEKGVKLITIRSQRELFEAKSLNYLTAVVAMMKAKKKGAEEGLYVGKNGEIYETTRCNFFAVINNQLITPKKDILIGVTRNVVIRLAKKLGIKLVERDLYLKELPKFQEAFITASNKEVMPVVRIDSQPIGLGKPAAVTKKIMEAFRQYTKNY